MAKNTVVHYRRTGTACGLTITDRMGANSYYTDVTCKNCIKVVDRENRETLWAGDTQELPTTLPEPEPETAPTTVEREEADQIFADQTPAAPAAPAATREAWLEAAVREIAETCFAGEKVPGVRISVGFAGGKGKKGLVKTIGQCWGNTAITDGKPQIFISPALEDPIQILETIVHELAHAVDDCKSGHKGNFKRLAIKAGLEGKMTATHASEALRASLAEMAKGLGEFPHTAIKVSADTKPGNKNRHLKMQCCFCEFTARSSRGAMEEFGMPEHCGIEMREV